MLARVRRWLSESPCKLGLAQTIVHNSCVSLSTARSQVAKLNRLRAWARPLHQPKLAAGLQYTRTVLYVVHQA
jgi:hypothetical protein